MAFDPCWEINLFKRIKEKIEKMNKMVLNKKTMGCACGGLAKEFKTDFHGFMVRGWKCKKRKEEYLDPRDVEPILKLNKLAKEHKLKSKIGIVGNSFTLRLPRVIVSAYDMFKGEEIEYVPQKEGVLLKVGI